MAKWALNLMGGSMKGKNKFVITLLISAAAICALFALRGLAQGGKAEPNRIAFKPGSSSASVSDKIRGDEEAEYVLAAQPGQEIILELDPSSRNLVAPTVSGPDNDPVSLDRDRMRRWHARLDKSGDYMVVIKKNKPTATVVRYTLKVQIPPR
jgi:hypothetical protein